MNKGFHETIVKYISEDGKEIADVLSGRDFPEDFLQSQRIEREIRILDFGFSSEDILRTEDQNNEVYIKFAEKSEDLFIGDRFILNHFPVCSKTCSEFRTGQRVLKIRLPERTKFYEYGGKIVLNRGMKYKITGKTLSRNPLNKDIVFTIYTCLLYPVIEVERELFRFL